jgi:hypothetical protein
VSAKIARRQAGGAEQSHRDPTTASELTNDPCPSNHWLSCTSLLRPGRFFVSRAFTKYASKPACSRMSYTAIQYTLIWNDLSTRSNCFLLPFFLLLLRGSASRGRGSFATVDHSDIRGSKPHNRDPSGAASGLVARVWSENLPHSVIEDSPFRGPSTTTYAASFAVPSSEQAHSKPRAAAHPSARFPLSSQWPR